MSLYICRIICLSIFLFRYKVYRHVYSDLFFYRSTKNIIFKDIFNIFNIYVKKDIMFVMLICRCKLTLIIYNIGKFILRKSCFYYEDMPLRGS